MIASPPSVKLITVPPFVVRSTALLPPVVSVFVAPPKLIVPARLLVARMPRPLSVRVIELAASNVTEPPFMPWMLTTLPPGLVMSTLFRLTTALTSLLGGKPWSPSMTKAWFVAPAVVWMATLLKVKVPVALFAASPRMVMPRAPVRLALLMVTLPAAPSMSMPVQNSYGRRGSFPS